MSFEIRMDGAYPELFDEFVGFKRGLGYAYGRSTVYVARLLSRHIAAFPADPQILTHEIAESFYAPDGKRATGSLRQRRAAVRQFSLFLRHKGIDCWVPPERSAPPPEPRFTPRIITVGEMASVITLADETPTSRISPSAHIVFAAMIRLLCCCGLRISEAVALTVGDVDLATGVLTIRHGKGNHARIVPMSQSLTRDIAAYAQRMRLESVEPGRAFFPNQRGAQYNTLAASNRVRGVIARAGVTVDGTRPARTHDLRHSYACQALRQMKEQGLDPYTTLPLLALYMGHRDIKSTEYYLRLTGPMAQDAADRMAGAYRNVFPEVD
jgi:integrase